jgi:hypothetical protein
MICCRDLGFEPVPSGSHIVLLMQDGEQLSLFKVVENDDGTFSPMAESWSSRKPMQYVHYSNFPLIALSF